MARRALVIGSETYGLRGCNADAELIRELLAARGFEVTLRTDADASRAGILAGFEALIADTRCDDAALVYYSGHGGRVVRPDWQARKAAGLPVHYQFLVPFDMAQSAENDFRGLLAEELTALQWRLTDKFRSAGKVPNVTLILDCCHAGYQARDLTLKAKGIGGAFPLRGIAQHLQTLHAATHSSDSDTNPYAVRIAACEPEQSAFERESEPGRYRGVLTESLAGVLRDLGTRKLSWATIMHLVRRRVLALIPEQRPEVEGPASRIPFTVEEHRNFGALPVSFHDGRSVIQAAPLLGVSLGDRFRLDSAEEPCTLGMAVVCAIEQDEAILDVTLDSAAAALPSAVYAIPVETSAGKRRVAVAVPEPSGAALRELIAQSPRLTVDSADPVFATIRAEDKGLAVHDTVGARARIVAEPDDAAGRRRTLQLIELLAAAQRLRELASGEEPFALVNPLQVTLAVGRAGMRQEQPLHGAHLTAGERVFLVLRNCSEGEVYIWVFDIGVSGRIALVTNQAPSGIRLGPRATPEDTRSIWGSEGAPLQWPADVGAGPADMPRLETFVIIVADRRQDLGALITPPGYRRSTERSPLDIVLEEVESGRREVPGEMADGDAALRYCVTRVEFFLTS
ncbi:MAG TPA: caspase family protein [Casimicrobiaceae bacterium]|nr:caspase family protein [Casimicrobiaceae bacterium]